MSGFNDEQQKAIDALTKGAPVVTETEEAAAIAEESSVVEKPIFDMEEKYGEPVEVSAESDEDQEELVDPTEEDKEPPKEEDTEEIAPDLELDSEPEDSKSKSDDIEFIKAGNKKIKIDYNDRAKTKKAYEMAAGMRKFQSERDEAIKERDESVEGGKKDREIIEACDKFVADEDDFGLFNYVSGGKDLNEIIEKEIEKRGELARMSPEELSAYKNKEVLDAKMKELDKRNEAILAREEKAQSDLNTSEINRQQSMINSVFNDNRFHGQFGEGAKARKDELKADRMLWKACIDTLSGYETIDKELIDKVVADEAASLRALINVQADRKANKTRKTVQKEAKAKVQEEVFDSGDKRQQKARLQSQIKEKDMKGALADLLGGNSIF